MQRKLSAALAAAFTVVLAIVGCSKHDLGVEPRLRLGAHGNPAAKPDSQPPHPTPPPDTTTVPPIEFLSADSVQAGSSGVSHWRIGNNGKKPFTSAWTLYPQYSDWPGYPIQGTIKLGPSKTAPLDVTFSVPASATSGLYLLFMAVTTFSGVTYQSYGYVRVYGNEPPPPPPPPPSPVLFFGSDSTLVGTSGNTTWQLTNESDHPFTMQWSLASVNGWPGFPIQGSTALSANGSTLINVSVPVPDTVSAGAHPLELTVTRPDTLPPASAQGWIFVYR
jgi:hypothetical protein